MRLKLVFIVSLLAAIVGAGSCIALVLGVFSRQALVQSRPTRPINLPVATGNDNLFFDLRLSSYRTATTTAGVFNSRARDATHHCTLHRHFDSHDAQRSNGTGSSWTTDRFLTSSTDRIQPNFFLHWSQRIDYETDVLVEIDS